MVAPEDGTLSVAEHDWTTTRIGVRMWTSWALTRPKPLERIRPPSMRACARREPASPGALGAVPVGTPVGHGPRGLQQRRDAWSYFTHDQARSRAYRWGEDGIGGISDDGQRLCFALALWNGTTRS